MTLQDITEFLQEPLLDPASFGAFWEASQASFPGSRGIPFLKPAAIEASLCYANIPQEPLARLLLMAERVESTPALARLAWHAHRRLVDQSALVPIGFAQWPTLLPLLGKEAGIFYFLIALSAIPQLQLVHQGLGIEERISRDTCKVIAAIYHAYERYSPPEADGGPLRYLDWIRNHLAGRLFRLGRMEWMMSLFAGPIHIYRHRQSGVATALMEGGLKVGANGGLCWKEEADLPGTWETAFEPGETEASGNPVLANGLVSREKVSLPLSEWEHRLSRGMNVLDLHIPAGGGMTPEACRDSFLEAARFFEKHFPQWRPSAFACQSWIFASALQEMLSPEMNLVRLQKEVHLYPLCTSPVSGLYFLFNTAERLPETLPAKATSVQRAVWSHLKQGKYWRVGGMYLLLEELPGFFEQRA